MSKTAPSPVLKGVPEVEKFIEDLFRTIPGQAASLGGAEDSETVLMTTSNVIGNIQSWRVPRDGWITGVASTTTSNFVVSVNVDPPAAAPTGTGITTGLLYPCGLNIGLQVGALRLRYPVKQNDIVNLKTYAASVVTVALVVNYPIQLTTG